MSATHSSILSPFRIGHFPISVDRLTYEGLPGKPRRIGRWATSSGKRPGEHPCVRDQANRVAAVDFTGGLSSCRLLEKARPFS